MVIIINNLTSYALSAISDKIIYFIFNCIRNTWRLKTRRDKTHMEASTTKRISSSILFRNSNLSMKTSESMLKSNKKWKLMARRKTSMESNKS